MCMPISPVDGCSDWLQLPLNLIVPVPLWLPSTILLLLQQVEEIGSVIGGTYAVNAWSKDMYMEELA